VSAARAAARQVRLHRSWSQTIGKGAGQQALLGLKETKRQEVRASSIRLRISPSTHSFDRLNILKFFAANLNGSIFRSKP